MTTTATTITVDSLPIASTIDPVQDRVLIYTASATDIQGISRNVFLGLASQPLGLSDTQSPTNKTFNNTNSLTIIAANLVIQDGTDNTKQAKFVASGITTGTTRIYTLPNTSDTFVGLAVAQILTNKTLIAPVTTAISNSGGLTTDTLSASGNATVGGTLGVTGNTTLGGTLAVTSTSTFTGTITTGGIAIGGSLTGTGLASQVQTFSSSGTFYYVNLGGIKYLWGTTSSITLSSGVSFNTYTITLPAFFTTVQMAIANASGTAFSTAYTYAVVTSASTSSVVITFAITNGTGATLTGDLFMIGT
jgi:hypothetical protein